ncbi:hypothetical protein EJB05_03041, partial [Eragrostis curvula]
MAKGKKKPIKKDESESEDDDLEFDKLSKKDMYKIMMLMKKIEEQELQLEKQEEFLISKMEELEGLSENHEKLNNAHISLTNDYDKLKKDYACATNSSLCVASLQQETCNLKAQLGVLTSKHYLAAKNDPIINEVIAACKARKVYDVMSIEKDWNNEIIAQFFATLYVEEHDDI